MIYAAKLKRYRSLDIHLTLKHPNIIELCTYFLGSSVNGWDENKLCCLIEYTRDSSNFSDYVKKIEKPLSTRELLYIFQQCLMGLSYMHSLDVIHRDIKPENIVVGPNLTGIKIIDLDECCHDYDKNKNPPEFNILPYNPTKAWDIWAMGYTFYRIITGNHFFPTFTWDIMCPTDSYISSKLKELDPIISDILGSMIVLDPLSRDTAQNLLSRVDSLIAEQ